jgi:hypothetical protein
MFLMSREPTSMQCMVCHRAAVIRKKRQRALGAEHGVQEIQLELILLVLALHSARAPAAKAAAEAAAEALCTHVPTGYA